VFRWVEKVYEMTKTVVNGGPAQISALKNDGLTEFALYLMKCLSLTGDPDVIAFYHRCYANPGLCVRAERMAWIYTIMSARYPGAILHLPGRDTAWSSDAMKMTRLLRDVEASTDGDVRHLSS
jgi:hypothetical protein